MRKIKYIVVHCTATSPSTSIESIQNYWKSIEWKSPGYHLIVQADGTTHQLADYSKVTNGVKGHNHHSVHIAYIGGIEGGKSKDTRTAQQKTAIKHLISQLKLQFPDAEELGHRDLSPDLDGDGVIERHEFIKDCPCYDVRAEK